MSSLATNPRLQKVVGHEKIVVTGLIVSDEFCREVNDLVTENMFEQTWLRALVAGCKEYFAAYGTAIKQNVAALVSTMQDDMNETEYDLILTFLEVLSRDYEKIESAFNLHFYIDEAKQFAKKKFEAPIRALLIEG